MSAVAEKAQPAAPSPAKCLVSNNGDVPVAVISLDSTRPQVVPGSLSSTLTKKGNGKYAYRMLFVPRLRAFQVECLRRDGTRSELVFIPETMVIQWVPDEEPKN